MKKLLSLLLALVMVFSLAACGAAEAPETTEGTTASTAAPEAAPTDASSDVTVLGEGETAFRFTVVDVDGTETAFEIHTNETTVGAALLAVELISGEDSEYGLYVKEVNGITADWDVDQTYWAFYINGEYAMTGVDSTEIDAASAYSFVKTGSGDTSSDVTVLGEGETAFRFTVVDVDGTETAFEIHTNETTVGAALLAVELISGEDSEYGLYVKEVNGITADWDADQSYWAFYVNGEYALTGVDSTEIDTASAYSFVKTVG